MKQVLMALERAGSAGIVHRDVKPENIMITQKGIIKVADFGLAQLVRADVEKSGVELTQVGTTMGTPLYMSPEQVHGQKLDQRSDLYSFGVTCFHMLAGEPPFRGETAMSVAIQHLNQAPPRLKDRRPDIPPALCQIVHKLMAKDPEDRYPDAGSVLKDVKHVQAALKAEIDPQSLRLSGIDWEMDENTGLSGWVKKISRWSVGRKIAAYVIACLLIAGVAAGFGFWTRPEDPLSQPATDQPQFSEKATAKEQFDLAKYNQDNNELLAPNEVAWKAVIDNFPDDTESRYPAMEQLGVLYLRMLRLDEAAKLFKDLENVEDGPLAAEYRAKGIAGQAVVAKFQGDEARVAELLEQLKTHQEINYLSPLKEWVDKLREESLPKNTDESGQNPM
jgi:serine/threonine-protein kinase